MTFDFKKEVGSLYAAKAKPQIVDVPAMVFLMVDGKGNPNTAKAWQDAVEALYGISYSIKMSKMSGTQPEGYFDYIVAPLEGLWWTEEGGYDASRPGEKDRLCWTSMIRQPPFVTQEVLEAAKQRLFQKKPQLNTAALRLGSLTEGLCAQILHTGPYDDEPATIAKMDAFLAEEGYRTDFTGQRTHHEIYLSDPRRTAADKLKTIIRHPIRV